MEGKKLGRVKEGKGVRESKECKGLEVEVEED